MTKTITVRIWLGFTVAVLVLTGIIRLSYSIIFRDAEIQSIAESLTAIHQILLEYNFDEFIQMQTFRNSYKMGHFTYSPHTDDIRLLHGSPEIPESCGHHRAMIRFATELMKSEVFIEHIRDKNMEYIFIISEMEDGSFFISYMPNAIDNNWILFLYITSGVAILLAATTAAITTIHISKLFSKLEHFAKKIAKKEWCEPLVMEHDDEIGRFADTMNSMQEILKLADKGVVEFFQNISHSLKTPVMIIQSIANLMIDDIEEVNLEEWAKKIHTEATRMDKMIEQLLFFGSLDYSLENISEVSAVKLDEIIIKIVDKFEIIGSSLDCDDSNIESVKVKGNAEKLTVAIENVWDNAIRYASSQVAISLTKHGNVARIEIFNDGKSIHAEEMPSLFDTLYVGEHGHFGLGLPIVKKIVEFYGGKILVENRENGVSFIIKLPIVT